MPGAPPRWSTSRCRSTACPQRCTASPSCRSATSTSARPSSAATSKRSSREINRLDADLVAVTGDLVDGSVRALAGDVAPLAGLASRHGTLLRHRQPRVLQRCARPGSPSCAGSACACCSNEHVVLRHGGGNGGAARSSSPASPIRARRTAIPSHRSDPRAALAGAPPGAAVRMLLAHQPRSAPAAAAAGFDLQLSGHTHGGQFLPWNFLVRLQQPFTAGLHRWGETVGLHQPRHRLLGAAEALRRAVGDHPAAAGAPALGGGPAPARCRARPAASQAGPCVSGG